MGSEVSQVLYLGKGYGDTMSSNPDMSVSMVSAADKTMSHA